MHDCLVKASSYHSRHLKTNAHASISMNPPRFGMNGSPLVRASAFYFLESQFPLVVFPMTLVCSISGYTPEEPVISKDGYIFERRLIEQVIGETGKCPITHSNLSKDDIRPVMQSSNNKALPIDSASLPSMIQSFEQEWNRLMVDSFNVKAQLHSTKEELARALYEQEASTRLVAQLTRERDEALSEVNRLQEELAQIHFNSEQ
jgi:pre-mRNA-processing factor 19